MLVSFASATQPTPATQLAATESPRCSLASHGPHCSSLGLNNALTSEPAIRAQCSSPACWDLYGRRLESFGRRAVPTVTDFGCSKAAGRNGLKGGRVPMLAEIWAPHNCVRFAHPGRRIFRRSGFALFLQSQCDYVCVEPRPSAFGHERTLRLSDQNSRKRRSLVQRRTQFLARIDRSNAQDHPHIRGRCGIAREKPTVIVGYA
jgi:hypothetical protein